ncbi:asparagine-linked glycosylation 9 protein isoform a [Artomyces pyxidatus]|uniref:Asparagine-linked glycosylation 9 protein isoform a n=1 Tax=Artomyces pyxidatus TaxID=48021 RepID=A0ACB8TI09_9AGAM|nr:asparagine-linked glycosylation 9 protein isoform a [Artomyces pyxidatus]
MSNFQTIRFRRPTNNQEAEKPPPTPKLRHTGILQDQLRRTARPPWSPSFSLAFRMLLLIRVTAAMYSNIQDCDEGKLFNFWEPLHYLDKGYGFQTWETSPVYAIRSWAYISLYYIPARLLDTVIHESGKRPAFFMVRAFLALTSSACEAKLYATVKDKINNRVARYMLFMMVTSAGMWNAATALLPSSFAMYTNALAFSFAFVPPSSRDNKRTLKATLLFATGAIVGWPFALALAIPFVFEELFIYGGDRVPADAKGGWLVSRWTRLMLCGAAAAQIAVPTTLIDTFFYGKVAAVPWNIVKYNVFPDASRGPNLYGTEPWYFYIQNLLLNFNVLVPLALISLPALFVTYRIDKRRLGAARPSPEESSPFTLLGIRLLPLYIWFGILTAQAHKEERFMYPAYPLICFNAAVTTYLVRGWVEVAFVKITKSPYRASKSSIFTFTTLFIVMFASLLSISRIFALWKYYHTPMTIVYAFEKEEIPSLLNATGLLPHPLPPPELMAEYKAKKIQNREDEDELDLSLIKQFELRLCLGKEWYRFPGHYLVPDGVRVDWIKSEFDGQLPAHFAETQGGVRSRVGGTRVVPKGLNDINNEEPMHYVDVSTCDYLIDLDFPDDPIESEHEPRYIADSKTWDHVICLPFLDVRHSSRLTRTLWLPGETWQSRNSFGDYCLLRNKKTVEKKIVEVRSAQSTKS